MLMLSHFVCCINTTKNYQKKTNSKALACIDKSMIHHGFWIPFVTVAELVNPTDKMAASDLKGILNWPSLNTKYAKYVLVYLLIWTCTDFWGREYTSTLIVHLERKRTWLSQIRRRCRQKYKKRSFLIFLFIAASLLDSIVRNSKRKIKIKTSRIYWKWTELCLQSQLGRTAEVVTVSERCGETHAALRLAASSTDALF